MNNPIEWRAPEQEQQVSIQSKDDVWRMLSSNYHTDNPDFFLSNSDLLLTPHGTGHDYREAFESFIAGCDVYIEKVRLAQEKAKQHLELMNHIAGNIPEK